MTQEAPRQSDQVHKFTRRHFGKLAVATAVVATVGACEIVKEKPRLDEALKAFASSNLNAEPGWTTYDHSQFFPVRLNIPPTWGVEGLTVAEGALISNAYNAFAIRKPKASFLFDVLVGYDDRVPAEWTNEKDNANYLNTLKVLDGVDAKDVKFTRVKLSGEEVTMVSYATGDGVFNPIRQHHNASTIRQGRRYQVTIKGSQDFVITEMPRFRRMVDSFQILPKT